MKKITFLFALLCASVMGFAIDWSGIDWLPGSNSTYKVVVSPAGPNIVQEQDWAGKRCIYVTYDGANFGDCSLDPSLFATQGAGKFYYTSAFLQQETEFTQVHNGTTYTFTVYNDKPVTVPSAKAPTPIVPASRVKGVYSMYDFNTGYTFANWCGNVKESSALVQGRTIPFYQIGSNCFGLEYGHFDVSNMTQIHLDIWTENAFNISFYLISPGHETDYTINLASGTWNSVDIPLSTFTAAGVDLNDVFQFKFANPSEANQTIFVDNIYFYAESDVDPDPTDIEDTNFALRSKGATAYGSSVTGANYPIKAIDGDGGTIWESVYDTDPQILAVDLGQRRNINLVKILWGNQWSSEFYIETSNNATDWTEAKHVTGNTDNYSHQEQSFDLNSKVTARYIRFRGIHRGNGWGYTIKTFTAMLSGVPVLTSVDLSTDKNIAKVGTYATLTASPKDQNSSAIAATLSYEVSPADAGHVTDGKYYPDKYAHATITVTAEAGGVQVTNNVQIWGVTSDNLALNKPSEAGYNPGNQGEINTKANDGDEGTLWVTWQNRPAAEEWWYVDLGTSYDITGINVSWGGDYSTNYILQVRAEAPSPEDKANDEAWTTLATVTTASANSSVFSQVTGTGRYVRFHSLSRSSGDCFRLRELQVFGSESSTPTKSVSASVNDPAMGTATVTQNDAPVTEVETGTEVTFSATPNEGYIFVEWSNGEKEATFNATVDAAMNLTATFRALGNIYCNTLVHSSNGGQEHDAYVTMKRSGENEYQLIVRAEYALGNFSNTEFRIKALNAAELSNYNLNNKGVLSADNHTLTGTIISTIEPEMISGKLYVNIVGQWEGQFDRLTNIEYSQPCADPEITAIALDKTEATLDMGNSLTLVPTFTPAYMSADIEWLTSDDAVATVANGVVTPVAPGTATITAKISETVKATCAVTVQAAASHNWYGYGTDKDLDYTYRIEYTTDHHIVAHVKRQGNKGGLVDAQMLISGVWTYINNTEDEEEGWKKGTTEATFTAGNNIHILIQSNFTGASSIIEFDYEVGSDNVMPTIVPSVLKLSNEAITMGLTDADIQLTTEIHHCDAANKTITWTSDDESVATVENGLVHPVGVGATTVHATTFNGISATCEVTVVGALEPTIFWGSGEDAGISILYSITRNADHTLSYAVEALHNKVGFVLQVNDGYYQDATLNEGVYTWSSTATYTDGDALNGFFYMPFSGGAGRVDFHYVVGSESEKGNMPIRLYEDQDNSFMITSSDGLIRDVKVTRTFPQTDEWYTLCLPFDLSAEQLTEAFGAGYTIAEMVGAEDRGSLIHLNFDYAPAFLAGKAYLLRPGTSITAAPTFEGVTVKNVDPATLKSANDYMEFQGTFDYITLDQANQRFVGPENYLYTPDPNGTHMKAFRCYFTIPSNSVLSGAPAKPARIVFGPQATTGIDEVEEDGVKAKIMVDGVLYIIRDGKTYNAQGMLVK